MSGFLTPEELERLAPAETAAFASPIPTQIVSSDEFFPRPQSMTQREVEARVKALGARLARRQGMSRRDFFSTAAGMAAAFLTMNEVYGAFFDVDGAEAATPELAAARARALAEQFVFDGHTHFLRDDTRLMGFVRLREAVRDAGWNPKLKGPQTIEDLKYDNYFKEMFLDSDTKVAIISSAPSDEPRDWFLTNEMMGAARKRINEAAGSRRLLSHAIFTPGAPGWLEALDRALALRPDSVKGYTIGDVLNPQGSRHPWRLDDEKVTYRAYEKFRKAGIRNVCVHKGLFPPSVERQFPRLRPYVDVSDVAKAAKDWPDLNFLIYHAGFRFVGAGSFAGLAAESRDQIEKTGRCDWVTDLAEIPSRHGVANVYADLGQVFACTVVESPRVAAFMLGTLVKGLGADHVVWGTDALWTGSPQWQIEALRRLEIPDAMRKRYGFAPLGAADGPVKSAILGGNSARLYGLAFPVGRPAGDRFSVLREEYLRSRPSRTNLRYGYVAV